MRRGYFFKTLTIILSIAATLSFADAAQKKPNSDSQIKKDMIQESIASYPGNCPCPYSAASNGSRCGKRSAYSRAGGYGPICYENDVTREMIKEWRENQ